MNALKHVESFQNDFVSLEEAKRLNNKLKSEAAWVYDRYQAASMEGIELTTSNIQEEFEKYMAKLPSIDSPPTDSIFRLVPVDTFDSQEQIEFLIGKGHFYYAPEVVIKKQPRETFPVVEAHKMGTKW